MVEWARLTMHTVTPLGHAALSTDPSAIAAVLAAGSEDEVLIHELEDA